MRRPHDVYHPKRVNSKIRKTCPLYSIRYKEENSESCAPWCPEPTMSMNVEGVSVFRRKASGSYVVEIKGGSVLAPQGRRSLTHDLYEGARLNPPRVPFVCRRPRDIASLYVASSLGGRFISIVIQGGPARRPPDFIGTSSGLRQPRRTMIRSGGRSDSGSPSALDKWQNEGKIVFRTNVRLSSVAPSELISATGARNFP